MWRSLSVAKELVGWLGWAFGIYCALLVGWTLWKGRRPKHAQRWMEYIARLRRFMGHAQGRIPVHAALLFSMFLIAALLLGAAKFKANQLHDVYVIAYDTDYHYHLRAPIRYADGSYHVTDFWTTFCHDYEPLFSTGQTLKVLTYEDQGACWSVKNTHPAYLIERDEHGKPIIR